MSPRQQQSMNNNNKSASERPISRLIVDDSISPIGDIILNLNESAKYISRIVQGTPAEKETPLSPRREQSLKKNNNKLAPISRRIVDDSLSPIGDIILNLSKSAKYISRIVQTTSAEKKTKVTVQRVTKKKPRALAAARRAKPSRKEALAVGIIPDDDEVSQMLKANLLALQDEVHAPSELRSSSAFPGLMDWEDFRSLIPELMDLDFDIQFE